MNAKHTLEFTVKLSKEFPDKRPHEIAEDVIALRRLARQLQNLNEDYCNGEMDSEQYHEKKEKIRSKLNNLGYRGILNGDPRGAAVKLSVPSGQTDDWGGEGLCVPE